MDPERTRYVVTAWRNNRELLQLREDLYSLSISRREKAVNKVFAWRLRKPDGLPLMLDSTADIVDVVVQDERGGLAHNRLRLLYSTALSRSITGLSDTSIDLTRCRPSWFPPGSTLQLPLTLLETRHRIVHRHLPSLAELKRAATEALQWLWDWYWAQLDHAFGQYPAEAEEGEDADAIREKIQGILKTYVKERKSEIKTRKKASKAAETALSTYTLRFSPNNTTTQKALLNSLETMILPADKKLGTTMSGAFLIWSPFLVAFSPILPTRILLNHLIRAMNAPTSSSRAMVNPEMDPVREGLCDWVVHILSSKEWPCATSPSFHEDILAQLFSEPTFWNLTVAERVVQDDRVVDRGMWKAVLDAARADGNGKGDEMDVEVEDMEKGMPVSGVMGEKEKEKSSGPRKVLGMWKARPIGWLPEGWEDDE